MKNLEKIGFPREQAEHLTNQMTDLVENTREKMSLKFVLNESLEKALMEQEARILAFKSELQKAQDMHLSAVTKDTERLQGSLERMRTDVKHDIDKLTASQRLDLNLEKGRMRDELQTLRDKSVDLELKMDREINALKAGIEQTKNETIKYVVAILGTFVAAGIGIARMVSG
eukprot:g2466.t1